MITDRVKGIGVVELYSRSGDPMGTGVADLIERHAGYYASYDYDVEAVVVVTAEALHDYGLPASWRLFVRPAHFPRYASFDGECGDLRNKYGSAVAIRQHRPFDSHFLSMDETEFALRVVVSKGRLV